MAVAMIGPKFYAWDRNGKPLAFGKLYTYQARTNVPKPTYQSEDQVVENTNPVILSGEGYANVYLDGSYKMVLKDDKDNEIWSSDPVSSAQASEWINCLTATYLNSTSFLLDGNFIDSYSEGRRVRVNNNTSEYSYSTVISSTYSGGKTTVVLSGSVVTTGLSGVCASIVGPESSIKTSFDSVLNMKEGSPDAGLVVSTKGYFYKGDGGNAEYLIKTPVQASDDEDISDGFVNHTLDNGNVAILQIGERINGKQCGMVADAYNTSSAQSSAGDWALNEEAILTPNYTDNSNALQAVIDYALKIPMRSPEIYIPAGAYAVTRAALIHHADGLLINGAGKMSTMFVPVGGMAPVLNDYFNEEQARLDAEFTDPTDPGIQYRTEKAVFMISQGRRSGADYAGRWRKQTGNANWSIAFTNIGCSGGETSTGLSTSFIFAPEFAQSLISNVYVEKVHTLLRTNDCYRMKIVQTEISNSFIPVDHFSTISQANAQAANPEATSNATGTSISLDACGGHNLAVGWKFVHIPYSSFNAVAVDNWSEKTASTGEITSYAYDFERCAGLVLNGCGSEDFSDNKPSGLFKITGGDEGTTIINGGVYVHPGNPEGTTGEVFLLDGLSLELNSCTISSSAGIAIQRGEVFIQGTSGASLDSFRNKTAYTQIYDGMPITNSRFIPTINGVGKQKFSLFRVVQATQTVTQDLTNGYKVTLDTNDSVRGFETQEYEAMQPSKDAIRIPYKGVFSVDICISHNALITDEVRLIKESPEGVRTKMIKYVTDSASRGIGEKNFSITAPFGQYDLVYLEIPQIASPGTIYTVTTSVHQI